MKPVEVCLPEPKWDAVMGTPICCLRWGARVRDVRPNTCLAAGMRRSGVFLGLGGKMELGCHVGTDPVSLPCAAQYLALRVLGMLRAWMSPYSTPPEWDLMADAVPTLLKLRLAFPSPHSAGEEGPGGGFRSLHMRQRIPKFSSCGADLA